MTAEPIARVVADLRAGRVRTLTRQTERFADSWHPDPVVDATAIYHSLVARNDPIAIYEDHPCIAPPWDHAAICYVNEHGNVIVMCSLAGSDDQRWDTAEPVDWDRVRWRLNTFLFIGGRGATGAMATLGPVHLWQYAIYDDGTPADLHWVQLEQRYPMEHWDMAHLVLLGALNFMNCRNVDIVDPIRPRPEARRIARTGVVVHTINVFPIGRSARTQRAASGAGTPLTSVRGHFACYGPEYDRGLLFGKYAGRYWIAQHARGAAELGESSHDYVLHTDAARATT